MMTRPFRHGTAAALLCGAVASLFAAAPASALPDLVPEIYDVRVNVRDVIQGDVDEGCADSRFGRTLVDFSIRTHNVGADDLVLGNPGCPNCTLNPGAECTNELFVCGTSHGHAHFESFAKNEILDENDVVVAEGRKYGFCLLDLNCPTPHYSCSNQGITAGCSDVYSAGLPCQYVDITDSDLPEGIYKIRVTIDPDNVFAESNEANNTIVVPFTLGNTDQICPSYASTDVPKAIPDNGVVTSTVTVPDLGPVTSLRLRMNGTHTYLGDLEVDLTSPEATTRNVFSQVCGTNNNFDVYLGDDAIDPFVCPATDDSVLRPAAQSFSAFYGEEAAGDWTLRIEDVSPNDTGSLQGWSLEICSICGNGLLDFGETCDDGNVSDGDCCSSDCLVQAAEGASCEDGSACTLAETCNADGECIPHDDVVCDPCLVCEADQGCVVPDLVYPCQEPATGNSLLKMRRNAEDSSRDTLLWKWRSQTPVELDEFGAPEVLTDISLCVYSAGELVLSSTIPAAQNCGSLPCWVRNEHDASFRDAAAQFGGLSQIRIKEGDRGKIVLRGLGDDLDLPELFLPLPTTVRMRRGDGTPCWEANYDASLLSTDSIFKAKSR